MIIRSIGRVHSFKISPQFILVAAIFFLLYIIASVFLINRYFDLRQTNILESQKIKRLEREVSRSQKIIYRSEQHVALLEDHIHDLEEERKPKPEPAKLANVEQRSTASNEKHLPNEADREEKSANAVDITEMDMRKEPTRLVVEFKLVKAQSSEDAVGGYIHIIAMGENPEPPPEWTFPQEKLENGFPINFRQGQRFLIQNFKPIHGEFTWVPNAQPPSHIRVLVYDRAGNLVLEKTFEVG